MCHNECCAPVQCVTASSFHCFRMVSNSLTFYLFINDIVVQIKDPDRVMKCLVSHIAAPQPDHVYKVFRGVNAQMMDPMT